MGPEKANFGKTNGWFDYFHLCCKLSKKHFPLGDAFFYSVIAPKVFK